VRDVFLYAVARGVPAEELLGRSGLRRADFDDPDARLPVESYYALIEAATELAGDALFGVHYVEHVAPEAIGAVGFLAVSSDTLGESIERIIRYHRVLTEGERFALERRDGTALFTLASAGPPRPAHGQIAEMYAHDCIVMGARLTGAPIDARWIEFRHAPHAKLEAYREIFGVAPRFEAAANRWAIPLEALLRPLPRAQPAFARRMEAELDTLLRVLPAGAPAPVAERLRPRIAARLPEGEPALSALARELQMSARTLQRRLRAEGVALRALVDEVRRAQALEWLGRGASIGEVSFLVGYSEPRAFHRAFRRWTGATPEAWRRRQASGAGSLRASAPSGNDSRAK
jgi:AraC-like DNA-binding protein